MKIGAMILGIVTGLFSMGYVGLFGGLFGSFMAWADPGGESGLNGGLIRAAALGLPVLALIGGGMAGSKPQIGGLMLLASAFGHLLLLGFGTLGFWFALPIAAAGALALGAAFLDPSDTENA